MLRSDAACASSLSAKSPLAPRRWASQNHREMIWCFVSISFSCSAVRGTCSGTCTCTPTGFPSLYRAT